MKKQTNKAAADDDLLPEYDFSKMKLVGRGIYAERYRSGTNLVRLDSDVRKAFPDDESINKVLRMVAKAIRDQGSKAKKSTVRKPTSRSRRAA